MYSKDITCSLVSSDLKKMSRQIKFSFKPNCSVMQTCLRIVKRICKMELGNLTETNIFHMVPHLLNGPIVSKLDPFILSDGFKLNFKKQVKKKTCCLDSGTALKQQNGHEMPNISKLHQIQSKCLQSQKDLH